MTSKVRDIVSMNILFRDSRTYSLYVMFFSLFIGLFLFLYKPFFLGGLSVSIVFNISLAISIFVPFVMSAHYLLVQVLAPKTIMNWTLGKELLWVISHLIIVSWFNYFLFNTVLTENFSLSQTMFMTFMVAVLPVSIDIALRYPRHTKNAKHISGTLYVRSDGNYIQIYTNSGNQIKRELRRATLKHFLETHEQQFLQIHKQFLVNKDRVMAIKGNSNGGEILLQGAVSVPYSRSHFHKIVVLQSTVEEPA